MEIVLHLPLSVVFSTFLQILAFLETLYQALRVDTANSLYFSAYIIRLLYKVADFVMEC